MPSGRKKVGYLFRSRTYKSAEYFTSSFFAFWTADRTIFGFSPIKWRPRTRRGPLAVFVFAPPRGEIQSRPSCERTFLPADSAADRYDVVVRMSRGKRFAYTVGERTKGRRRFLGGRGGGGRVCAGSRTAEVLVSPSIPTPMHVRCTRRRFELLNGRVRPSQRQCQPNVTAGQYSGAHGAARPPAVHPSTTTVPRDRCRRLFFQVIDKVRRTRGAPALTKNPPSPAFVDNTQYCGNKSVNIANYRTALAPHFRPTPSEKPNNDFGLYGRKWSYRSKKYNSRAGVMRPQVRFPRVFAVRSRGITEVFLKRKNINDIYREIKSTRIPCNHYYRVSKYIFIYDRFVNGAKRTANRTGNVSGIGVRIVRYL